MIAITANTSWYIYNFRQNTIKALITAGYNVVAIAPRDSYSSRLESLGCKFIHLPINQGGKNPLQDTRALFNFYRSFKQNSVRCVLNFTPKNNIYATLAASLLKIKAINNIAGLGTLFIEESLSSKIARVLYKISQKKASKIFFQNEDDRSLFLQGGFAHESITERLPGSGVDLTRFTPSPAADDGVVRFLLIARMLYDKGVGHYVEAARYLKQKYNRNVEFYLLGFLGVNNPSAISELEMQAWVDEGIVMYLGTSDSVEEEIAKVDCMVLPSFYREGVPKSLLESGAMGKPIVTTDNVGCRETVEHGVNGFLCQPRSTESLIGALEKVILMTHEQRLQMGQESREKMSREFNEEIIIDKYLQAIAQCYQKN
ncbi:glycosyltransferase family 4 protein [Providencia sp. 2024EL-00732]|uniref:glycosyltransferase family 4 protein n=1 Tax=Providencia sp. 2024EL-00732 TaxID=3374242 RepID=UPI003756EA5E